LAAYAPVAVSHLPAPAENRAYVQQFIQYEWIYQVFPGAYWNVDTFFYLRCTACRFVGFALTPVEQRLPGGVRHHGRA
jgi:hypothetical protein